MAETYINGGNTRDLTYGYNLLGNYSQSWNRYAYAFNSPASLVDPSGFDTTQPSDDELPEEPIDTVTVIGNGIGFGSIEGGSAIHFGHVGGGFSMAGAAGSRSTRPAGGGEGNACLWASVECWVTVDPFMTIHAKVLWGSSNAMPIVHGFGSTVGGDASSWLTRLRGSINGYAERAVDYWIEQDAWYSPVMGTLVMSMTAKYDIQTVTSLAGGGFGSLAMKAGHLTGNGVRSQVLGSVQRGLGATGGYTDWELA